MGNTVSITAYFDKSLAILLSEKIEAVFKEFDTASFIDKVDKDLKSSVLNLQPYNSK